MPSPGTLRKARLLIAAQLAVPYGWRQTLAGRTQKEDK